MSTLIIPSLPKRRKGSIILLGICFAILSVYPVYRNFYYSNGLHTYERHIAILEKRSEFYNPWQYRVLCPYTIEALMWVYNHTIDKVYPVEEKLHFNIESTSGTSAETAEFVKLMQTPGAIKYMLVFILFRAIEHFFILVLAWRLWSYFIKSKWLIFLGINFLALAMGNAVTAADLSFNTYMDIIFYLLTANIIVYKKSPWLIIPITTLAAFNRETGMLIPALYFISQADLTKLNFKKIAFKAIGLPEKKAWMITIISYIIFFTIFFALRKYFGYRPQQLWKAPAGLPMLKLNLFSAVGAKAYFELIGTFAVLPLIILYKFKSFPHLLKKWFVFLVPLWFAIHYITVVVYQTRLFMVPMIIVMLPMILWLVEKEIRSQYSNTA